MTANLDRTGRRVTGPPGDVQSALRGRKQHVQGLELISKCVVEDDDGSELEEGEVGVGFAVAADLDSAAAAQPGVGALDRPALPGQGVGCLESFLFPDPDLAHGCAWLDRLGSVARFADVGLDPSLSELGEQLVGVVAAVGAELDRDAAARGELVEQRQQVALLVFVAGRQSDLEREPAPVYCEVKTASRLAAECARDLRAPFFASTVEASTITRDQSSRCAFASWSCSTSITPAKSPRRCHSSNRRLHVSPLGNPSCR